MTSCYFRNTYKVLNIYNSQHKDISTFLQIKSETADKILKYVIK